MTNPGLNTTMGLAYYGNSRPPSRPGTPGHYIPTLPPSASSTTTSTHPNSHPYGQARSASNPKSASADDFNFGVPSFPPRLANFGRKISQMGNDFLSEFDDPGPKRSIEAPKPIPSPKPEDVPGMGDEPVMCPFCEKPLPPLLFASHTHATSAAMTPTASGSATPGPGPGTLKRSNTSTGMKPRSNVRELSRATPIRENRILEALPVVSPSAAVPSINADALRAEVTAADKANAYAAGVVVDGADLRRWAAIAGLSAPPAVPTATPDSEIDNPIPKIAPPPSGTTKNRAASDSSGFGLFKEAKAKNAQGEDDDSEEEGQGNGYAMLTGAGSDTEDEEDKQEVLHDEPEEHIEEEDKLEKQESEKAPTPTAPEASSEELKNVLQEVLAKLGEMVCFCNDLSDHSLNHIPRCSRHNRPSSHH